MDWAKTYLKEFNNIVNETPYSPLELAFGILTNIPGNNVIIMGLDSSNQLCENLKILEKTKIGIAWKSLRRIISLLLF